MNLILFSEADCTAPSRVRLTDRRATHIRTVHRAEIGDKLRVGKIGGQIGEGEVVALDETSVELEVHLTNGPPAPLSMTLFLALPRPKFLARCLQVATTLGIKEIYLFNSYRVDKVYWSCQQLSPEDVRESCLLGLEQARDTVLPRVHQRRLFKPFVEDECPALLRETEAYLAHPTAERLCPRETTKPVSLAIGPEGGFIDYEIEKLEAAGFTTVRTLERILKVETAIASLVGRLL